MRSRLNYFNFKSFGKHILITNDVGRYDFLSKEEFRLFVTEKYTDSEALTKRLVHNWFVRDVQDDIFVTRIQEDMRRSKNHLFLPTSLFILVVTHRCNSQCVYCQSQTTGLKKQDADMTIDVAKRAVDMALSSPCSNITIEFQGGEPLLNYEVIKDTVIYTEQQRNENKEVHFALATNLTLLTPEMLSFFVKHKVNISTSLDGNKECHNNNRLLLNGENNFDLVVNKIENIQNCGLPVGAVQTTTRNSLNKAKETVDAYLKLNLKNIFIRPLTPLGFAAEYWDKLGYAPEEFVQFYKECLQYILKINKGGTFIAEGHALIWLRKIIGCVQSNYMELRSPCGAAIGQIAITENGNIYTCDEARMLSQMGNESFLLGNIYEDTYDDIMNSDITKTMCVASTLESLPRCCDCTYQPYCGVCPVINLAMYDNIFAREVQGYKCKIYEGMLDTIFNVLKNNNPNEIAVFESWL